GFANILEGFLRLRQARENVADGGVQHFAFVRERQSARVTLEKRRRDFFFERTDLSADGRLAERQHLARVRETASRGHGVEDAKLVPVHILLPSWRRSLASTILRVQCKVHDRSFQCAPARKRSASSAAMQPMAAAVTA